MPKSTKDAIDADDLAAMHRMPELELLPPGTHVSILGDPSVDGVPGIVTRIAIGTNLSVTYEVGWWSGRDYKACWFFPFQIVSRNPKTIRIGFKHE